MPTTRKTSTTVISKTHRSPRSANKKPAHAHSAPAPAAAEYDAAVSHQEIAEVAYRHSLERAGEPGSPVEDWLKAETEVRARSTSAGA